METAGGIKILFLALASWVIATPAWAETIDISDSHGGLVAAYEAQWAELAARGVRIRMVGPCQSACTVLIGRIPRSRICVMPQARFGFHLATAPSATEILWETYPADIRTWISRHGGLSWNLLWMQAPDTYRFFRKCQERDKIMRKPLSTG
jgi:hypothetical protein